MNYIKHFFLSTLKKQTENQMNKILPGNDYGKLISMNLKAGNDCVMTQIMKFENYTGSQILTDSERKKLQSIFSMDLEKEMRGQNKEKKTCESMFASINFTNKLIRVQWNYTDKTNKILDI